MHVHSYTLRHLHTQPHSNSTHTLIHTYVDRFMDGNTLHVHCITLTHPQTHTATPSPQTQARSHTCRGNFSLDLPNTTTSPHSQPPSQIQASIPAGQGLGGRWPASRGPGRDSASAERVVPNPSLGSGTPASRPRVRSGAAAEAQPLPPSRGPSPGRGSPGRGRRRGCSPAEPGGRCRRRGQRGPVPTPPGCLPGPVGLRPGLHGAGGPGRGRCGCGRECGLRDPALRSPWLRGRAGCGAPSER